MTNFKQYFRSHIRQNGKNLICIFVIAITLTFVLAITEQPHVLLHNQDKYCRFNTLFAAVYYMIILVYILPVIQFSCFKKRINLDCAYSLPVSRRTMGIVHYLTGLIVLFSTFTASHLLNFVVLLNRGLTWYNPPSMIVHYFLCLLFGFAIYSIMVFVFNEANTTGDGIWFMILYTFVVFLVLSAVGEIQHIPNLYLYEEAGTPFILTVMTEIYEISFEFGSAQASFWKHPEYVTMSLFWIIAGMASVIGFFFSFGKKERK